MNAYEFIVKMNEVAGQDLQEIAKSVGMQVIEVSAEYDNLRATLTNTFNSADLGQSALKMLDEFAAETPFALNELTGAFVNLVNAGFNPTQDQLHKMGDLATSQGKSFDELGTAIIAAGDGSFGKLNDFGIDASKAGDLVTLSFKGVTTTVKNNAAAIRDAILQYGDMRGVVGTMDTMGQTLDGRISELGDRWNTFLAAVGGESSGIFTGVIDILSGALDFLSSHLSDIVTWFRVLWSLISPVVDAIGKFIQAAFGFQSVGDAVGSFGDIMTGVLLVVDWFSTGLSTIIGWLTPFTDYIIEAVIAWTALNLAFSLSPLGWIVLGIMAIIMVIGMAIKYTSGWGEAWQHVVKGAGLIWDIVVDAVKSSWDRLVNNIMIGINNIQAAWYSFKETMGMGNSDENQKMLAQLTADTVAREKVIKNANGADKRIEGLEEQVKKEFGAVSITVDANGITKDLKAISNMFAGGDKKNKNLANPSDFTTKNNKGTQPPAGEGTTDGIVSGGAKATHITVQIDKLQDDTKIYVSNTEQGLQQLGDKVQEMLLRAVNSVNQMQTT